MLSALVLPGATYARIDTACQYKHTGAIHRAVANNYDTRFTYEQNFNLQLDKTISQTDAQDIARCILGKSKAVSVLKKKLGTVHFSQNVYLFPANDYSYGVVGYSQNLVNIERAINLSRPEGVVAKMSYKINLDGTAEEFDVIAAQFNTQHQPFWYRYSDGILNRQDEQCLECHMNRKASSYLFLEKNFQKLGESTKSTVPIIEN
jgi:hypothetical protein